MFHQYPERPLDPPDVEDSVIPQLTEAQAVAVMDDLYDGDDTSWQMLFDDVWEALDCATNNWPTRTEEIARDIIHADQVRAMNRKATEEAIARGVIDELADIAALGKPQAE